MLKAITGEHDALPEFPAELNEGECMDDTRDRIADRESIEMLRETIGEEGLAACRRAAAKYPEKFTPMLRKAGFLMCRIG